MLNLCQLLFLRQWSPFDHFEGRQDHSDWDKLPLNPHHCSDKILIRDILFNLCINPENGSNLNPICFCEREYAHTCMHHFFCATRNDKWLCFMGWKHVRKFNQELFPRIFNLAHLRAFIQVRANSCSLINLKSNHIIRKSIANYCCESRMQIWDRTRVELHNQTVGVDRNLNE